MSSNKSLINIREDGTVDGRIDGYDQFNYIPSASSSNVKPIVIDSTLSEIAITRNAPLNDGLGTTAVERVLINPVTEQLLTGTVYGNFSMNEQVFQSVITPVLVNGLQLNGVTADEYLPTVGSIGATGEFLGKKAAEFKGSYLDTNTKAAGIRLPSFSSTSFPYMLIEGFMYLEQEPSDNYDPILITRSTDGVSNTTQDSFRLEYDTSANQLQFHFSPASYSGSGYSNVVNVSPVSGVTLDQWHHFAITYLNQGGSAAVMTYWNGTRLFTATGFTGNIKNSSGFVCVGSGASGDKPYKGWLDDIMISAGATTTALRSFQPGATAPVPTDAISSGDYTVYLLSMNGPKGSSIFPCDTQEKVMSTVTYVDRFNGVIGAGNIVRVDDSIVGLSLFSGVCSGHEKTGVCGAAYAFGYNSGAAMYVNNVDHLQPTLVASQRVRNTMVDLTVAYLLGATAMRGFSGASGDFPKLFSRNWGGDTFTFLPVQANIANIRSIYDNIVINGRTANYNISDFEGNVYSMATADIKNLYSDIVSYHSTAVLTGTGIKSAIQGATTAENLNKIAGFTGEGFAVKIAPSIDEVGVLFISPKARATKKTTVPETKYIKDGGKGGLGDEGPLGG
jgi:hypothetical protein